MSTIEQDFEKNKANILQLIGKYHKSRMKDKEILTTIEKAINSSIELRSKKVLIEDFVNALANTDVDRDWRIFVDESRTK